MDGRDVYVRATKLIVPLYVRALGKNIELGKKDVCPYLPSPIEARLDVLPEPYLLELPPKLGGGKVPISVGDPKLGLHPGRLEASATLTAV
jgi:hypothetical protein